MTSPPPSAERRQALRADAGSLYAGQLAADPAAQDYLAARGISPALARRLELGAAGHGWTGVVDQLRGRGYTDTELVTSGVAFRSSRGTVVDTFRSRVLFPAHDEQGVLVGWAGRSTPAAPQQAPRWLNSTAGDYRKAELLHGLHEGRVRLATGATPVLCEGVLDAHAVTVATRGACIGLAPGGTALTMQHIAALGHAVASRDDDGHRTALGRVLVAFDGDGAGRRAAVATWPLLQATGAEAALVTLPAGTDPCDAGLDVLRAALRAASPLEDLVVDEVLAAWPDRRRFAEHQVHALRAAARATASMPPDRIGRQVCRISATLHLPVAEVTREVTDAASRSTTIRGAGSGAESDFWYQTDPTSGLASRSGLSANASSS